MKLHQIGKRCSFSGIAKACPACEAVRISTACYQSELIAHHPFYELNRRITRLFFDLIAIANSYAPIDYSYAFVSGRTCR